MGVGNRGKGGLGPAPGAPGRLPPFGEVKGAAVPEEIAIVMVMGMLMGLGWGVLNTVKTIMIKRYETKASGAPEGLREQLDRLERKVDALGEGVMLRMQDAEERIDFAERMLANRDPDRLPGGGVH